MNYSVLKNRFGFDSVAMSAVDGSVSGNAGPFTVSGIRWMHLLWGGRPALNDFANSVVDAQEVVLNFPRSQYKLHCERLRVSVPDSEMVADSLELHPLVGDEEFFRGSPFSRTRVIFVSPQCSVMGLACLELLQWKMYCTRAVHINDMRMDILVNFDKGEPTNSVPLRMPSEVLSLMKGIVQIDSLSILNGLLNYGERFAVGAKPAVITFDGIQVLAEGIANHGDRGAAVVIHAQGKIMKAGTVRVQMSFPVGSPEFSFQYSGSLGRMDISALNPYLETAEQMRIKQGVVQAVTFEINVASGRASGNVQAVYTDLAFAAINEHTGSEKGFSDRITSFIARSFKIRGTNVPDKSGATKIGEVKYIRQRDDPFFRFLWFALRSGVYDVVGL